MPQNFEVGATHTGEAFMEFIYDLLEYAIPRWGYQWNETPKSVRSCKKIFKESFGDAIILFRSRHEEELERCSMYFQSERGWNIAGYSDQFCKRTFKGEIPLMELIAYFAFLLESCLFFYKMDEPDDLHLLTDESFGVYYKYVDRYFNVVGGWHALYQVAEQYVNYINSTPVDIMPASSSEDTSVLKL